MGRIRIKSVAIGGEVKLETEIVHAADDSGLSIPPWRTLYSRLVPIGTNIGLVIPTILYELTIFKALIYFVITKSSKIQLVERSNIVRKLSFECSICQPFPGKNHRTPPPPALFRGGYSIPLDLDRSGAETLTMQLLTLLGVLNAHGCKL